MKKKLFIFITFIFCTILFLTNTTEKEVKADTCEVFKNYYLFLDVSDISVYTDNTGIRTTEKEFGLGIPQNAEIIKRTQLKLSAVATEEPNTMTLEEFYELHNAVSYQMGTLRRANNVYASNGYWTGDGCRYSENDATGKVCGSIKISDYSDSYEHFLNHCTLDDTSSNLGIISSSEKMVTTTITRSYQETDVDQSVIGQGKVWAPAVYYVEYKVCEDEPEETYNVTIEYRDVDTNEEIVNSTKLFQTPVPTTETYSYDCSEKTGIPANYVLDTTRETEFSGNGSRGNVTKVCWYKEVQEERYRVKQFYYDENNLEIKQSEYLKNSQNEVIYYKNGDSYTQKCPSKIEYNGGVYNFNNANPNSGTINKEEGVINCYYDTPIYTITVNYDADNSCSGALGNDTIDNVKGGSSQSLTIPERIGDYTLSGIGSVSPTIDITQDNKNLTFEMPHKNLTICVEYIKNPQTGVGMIYFIFLIGFGSLGYSIWYFTKHRKQNIV